MQFSTTLLVTAGLAVLGVVGAVIAYWYYEQYRQTKRNDFEQFLDDVDDGDVVDYSPPNVSAGVLGYVQVARHILKSKRLAKKGYVKWYRLDSTLSRPKWVKPKQDGTGLPKTTVDGQPYYFPKDAMVADSITGAYVALHREGAADPINLRDPAYPGIEADLVERTINLEAEDKPPGLLDDLFGMDQTTLMYLVIGVMFVIYAGFRYMNGGL